MLKLNSFFDWKQGWMNYAIVEGVNLNSSMMEFGCRSDYETACFVVTLFCFHGNHTEFSSDHCWANAEGLDSRAKFACPLPYIAEHFFV